MSDHEVIGQLKGTGGQLAIEWEIADFLSLSSEVNKQYHSPMSFFGETSWYIRVHPNGEKDHSSEGFIGVYVCRGDSGLPLTATFTLFLKMKDGSRALCSEKKNTFRGKHDGLGLYKAMSRSELIERKSEFMPSGALKIICSLKFNQDEGVKKITESVYEVVGQLKGTGAQLDIEWEIADFLSLSADVDKHYHSSMCFFGDTSWYIRVYPNGEKDHSSEGYIGMYVCRADSGFPVTATYSLFLETKGGSKVLCSGRKNTFKDKNYGWGLKKALSRFQLIERESEFLPSGALKVGCLLKFGEERMMKDFESKALAAAVQDMKVLRDYKELLLSEERCDVTLQVSGQKFSAHRTILSARSSVFASMLRHDMKEKITGVIDIPDCDPEHFPDFLSFLYCGSVECITSQNACSLYRAADKYDVQDLKSECLAFMKIHLDVDHFCDVITLAFQHDEADLIKVAIDFFAENMLKIIVTVEWQLFLTENPIRGNELTIRAVSAKKKKNKDGPLTL